MPRNAVPVSELDDLPLYGTPDEIAEYVSRTRFRVAGATVRTHWREEGLVFVIIEGRARAKFADALIVADAKIAEAKPSTRMRGNLDPHHVMSGDGSARRRAAEARDARSVR